MRTAICRNPSSSNPSPCNGCNLYYGNVKDCFMAAPIINVVSQNSLYLRKGWQVIVTSIVRQTDRAEVAQPRAPSRQRCHDFPRGHCSPKRHNHQIIFLSKIRRSSCDNKSSFGRHHYKSTPVTPLLVTFCVYEGTPGSPP